MHLTLPRRSQIEALKSSGFSNRYVAKQLGCSHTTINKEIRRNSDNGHYAYDFADARATERRRLASSIPRIMTSEMKATIDSCLNQQWSPVQISGRLKQQGQKTVSHESIYKHIRTDKKDGGDLYKNLRHGGKKYNKRLGKTGGRGFITDRVGIEERPAIVDEKSRVGDFEADTIIGANHKGVIVSLVDRVTKLVMLRLVENKTAQAVTDAIVDMLKPFGDAGHAHTITFDNGKEFAFHSLICSFFSMLKSFFAQPYHSWERGLNEHTNGLVRQYLPKGTDFSKVSVEELAKIETLLNNRPRKILDYETPCEALTRITAIPWGGNFQP